MKEKNIKKRIHTHKFSIFMHINGFKTIKNNMINSMENISTKSTYFRMKTKHLYYDNIN